MCSCRRTTRQLRISSQSGKIACSLTRGRITPLKGSLGSVKQPVRSVNIANPVAFFGSPDIFGTNSSPRRIISFIRLSGGHPLYQWRALQLGATNVSLGHEPAVSTQRRGPVNTEGTARIANPLLNPGQGTLGRLIYLSPALQCRGGCGGAEARSTGSIGPITSPGGASRGTKSSAGTYVPPETNGRGHSVGRVGQSRNGLAALIQGITKSSLLKTGRHSDPIHCGRLTVG